MYALGRLGTTYTSLKDYQKAIEYYQQGLAIARESKNRKLEALTLVAIGNVYHHSLENYLKTIDYYQQALTIARQIKNCQICRCVVSESQTHQ